jgi:hypothetical protein
MEEIILQFLEKEIPNLKEMLFEVVKNREDFSKLVLGTKEKLDKLGIEILKQMLEQVNELFRKDAIRKKEWDIERKKDTKSLATIFGNVEYERTYYQNKKDGSYKYLSDEYLGIEVHDRMDTSFEAKLIELSIENSYRTSGEEVSDNIQFSSQTVMNCIRDLGEIDNLINVKLQEKRDATVLYIEADEDHVALQQGGIIMPRLVYIHEGYEEQDGKSKRKKLKNVYYFSGVYSSSEELWLEVAQYIDLIYDEEKIEKIFISGDGASWIRQGLGWIKGTKFILDRYHLNKYIMIASGHMPMYRSELWHAINTINKDLLKNVFKEILNETVSETKLKAVIDVRRYILNNWDGIENYYADEDAMGCSAEGHVSHVLSDRLSSRPLGWCKTGVNQISRLRAFAFNDGNVYEILINQKKERKYDIKIAKETEKVLKARLKYDRIPNEKLNNIEIINYGKKTWEFDLIKSIKHA